MGPWEKYQSKPQGAPWEAFAEPDRGPRGRERREYAPAPDPFEGLPQEVISDIEARFPIPTGERVRGGAVAGAKTLRKRAAELEQIRMVKPALANLIEETGGLEAFLVGAGRGLYTIGRGVGVLDPEDEIVTQGVEGLRTQRPAAVTGGEVVGETAPFLLAGPATGLAKTAATKTLATGALGAAEAGISTRGRGGTPEEVAAATGLGFVTGGAIPMASSIASRARSKTLEKGKELLREPTKKQVSKAVSEAAPTTEQLRETSRKIYDAVQGDGISINEDSYKKLISSTLSDAKSLGFKPTAAGKKLNPEASNVIDLLKEFKDSVSVADMEDVRRAAQQSASAASRAGRNQDAAISGSIVDNIDQFLGTIKTADFKGNITSTVGDELKTARKLWGAARKQELLDEAIETGQSRAAGAERGIRNELNRILNNKKQSRFFNSDEKAAIRKVVEGTPAANTFRRLGQMGFGRGQQTSVTSGLLGSGVGATIMAELFGPMGAGIGALLLPTVGTVSKSLAESLTRKNARLAGQVIRAGSNGDEIARAYLRLTPKAERSSRDLAQLLMRPDIDLNLKSSSKIARDASQKALDLRQMTAAAGGSALSAQLAAEEN